MQLREGWHQVVSRAWLRSFMGLLAAYHLIALPCVLALGPVVADRELSGASSWATIVTLFATGSIVGSALGLRVHPRRPMVVCAVAFLGLRRDRDSSRRSRPARSRCATCAPSRPGRGWWPPPKAAVIRTPGTPASPMFRSARGEEGTHHELFQPAARHRPSHPVRPRPALAPAPPLLLGASDMPVRPRILSQPAYCVPVVRETPRPVAASGSAW